MSHNHQKKIAVINDISGFGRCSIAVSMPIISYMGIQCCPVPTSIFSNHTGFESYYFNDYTPYMRSYIDEWKKLDLRFEGIMTGFLGSKEQIEIVRDFIKWFKNEHTMVIMDPAMGENGHPYPTYTDEMCQEMKRLIEYADIITPNVTEACILTDTEYKERGWKKQELCDMAKRLLDTGAKKVAISGVRMGHYVGNVIAQQGSEPVLLKHERVGAYRSGTGDIYSAIIASDSINGVDFMASVKKASGFVKRCMGVTEKLAIPDTDGLAFEEVLYTLKRD
ncbi:MAG: pyridoxamine kinase [Lachnospira sp.]|nr:pyridoxamine kinase [Lachnospira sp.]